MPKSAAAKSPTKTAKRLLVVDDDRSNRITLAALLEEHADFIISEASSIAEARRQLEQATIPFDLILLDYHLGDGVGAEIVPMVRKHAPKAKILLISTSVDHNALAGLKIDAIVPKAADFPDMMAMIHQLLA